MSTDPIGERLSFAMTLIRDAGRLAHGYFQRLDELTIKSKGLQDMASEADTNTELLIKEGIAQAFPQDAFFGEETGAAGLEGAEGVWVVDPIDGTQPFVCGMHTWCISIAYLRGDDIEFGLVYAPSNDELFVGRKGGVATLNGRPIHPHPGTSFKDGIVSVGYSSRVGKAAALPVLERLLDQGGMFYRNGSGTLSLCYVAAGRLLGYVERHMNSWDAVAGIAIVRAAGGVTNDFMTGDALTRGNRIIAGPPALYDALEQVLEG